MGGNASRDGPVPFLSRTKTLQQCNIVGSAQDSAIQINHDSHQATFSFFFLTNNMKKEFPVSAALSDFVSLCTVITENFPEQETYQCTPPFSFKYLLAIVLRFLLPSWVKKMSPSLSLIWPFHILNDRYAEVLKNKVIKFTF